MGISKPLLSIAAMAFVLVVVDVAHGQAKPKVKIVSAVEDDARRAQLEADLRSGDKAKIDAAIATISDAVLTRGKGRPGDLNVLVAAGFASEAEAVCVRGILENAANSSMVATFTRQRVRCLQAKKDFPAALSAAKAYYNVCGQKDVPYAVHLFSECLSAAFPNDPELPARFERQQLAGAFATAGSDPPANLGAPVLASVTIDPGPYREKIGHMIGNDYAQLVSKANLLLLSDDAGQAIELIERAIAIAPAKKREDAHQHMARAIRAKNGRSGEADAYLSHSASTTTP